MTVVIDKVFKVDGLLHRVNGPAAIWKYEDEDIWQWWLFGNNHRYYGVSNGRNEWDIHGKPIK